MIDTTYVCAYDISFIDYPAMTQETVNNIFYTIHKSDMEMLQFILAFVVMGVILAYIGYALGLITAALKKYFEKRDKDDQFTKGYLVGQLGLLRSFNKSVSEILARNMDILMASKNKEGMDVLVKLSEELTDSILNATCELEKKYDSVMECKDPSTNS